MNIRKFAFVLRNRIILLRASIRIVSPQGRFTFEHTRTPTACPRLPTSPIHKRRRCAARVRSGRATWRAAAPAPHARPSASRAHPPQVLALFRFLDTDNDGAPPARRWTLAHGHPCHCLQSDRIVRACAGLLSPRSARNLCASLGFHVEPPRHPGEPGATAIGSEDLLHWVDAYLGQAHRNKEIQNAQTFALLKSYDPYSSAARHVSRDALQVFLSSEQHKVRGRMRMRRQQARPRWLSPGLACASPPVPRTMTRLAPPPDAPRWRRPRSTRW
jgi:hypothetical protein